ncbi:MAG: hypothetical protein GEU71_17670 [Actinobacteria bacterium]|nr:hypothetical protein [Actinomycetota bacterium]
MADGYSGPVRILDSNGILLTVGFADLSAVEEYSTWGGWLKVLDGTGVAGKALRVGLVVPDGATATAQLDPDSVEEEYAVSEVFGIGPAPF